MIYARRVTGHAIYSTSPHLFSLPYHHIYIRTFISGLRFYPKIQRYSVPIANTEFEFSEPKSPLTMSYYPTSSHPQVGPSQYKRAKNDMPLVGIYEDVSRLCKQTRLAPVPPLLGRTVEETAWRHEDVRWAREFQPRAHFAKLAARNARDSSAQNYVQRETDFFFAAPHVLRIT